MIHLPVLGNKKALISFPIRAFCADLEGGVLTFQVREDDSEGLVLVIFRFLHLEYSSFVLSVLS